jgi:hypothetical protein
MSLANDIVAVKKAVENNWKDIIETAGQLEKLISDGLLWLEDEGNIQKINSTLTNIQIPTFSASNPIPNGLFDSTLSELQQKIDPLLSSLQTLEQDITPSSILDSIESHLPDMPDLPGIPGLDIAKVKRVLNAILDDGFSISLNELPYNSNNNITNSNIADSSNANNVQPNANSNLKTDNINKGLSNGITEIFQNYYGKNQATIDNLFKDFESLLSDKDLSDFEQILSSTTSSYLTSNQPITSSTLINIMGQVVQNTSDKAKTISQLLTNQFSSNLVILKTILTDLLNTQIDTESDLYALYTEIKPSQTTPTLLQVISLSLSIPVTLISKAVSGENLIFHKSLFQENESENNGIITAEGVFCIINAISSVINYIFEKKCEEDNIQLLASRGDSISWGEKSSNNLENYPIFLSITTLCKIFETLIMTPEIREEISDTDYVTQLSVYIFKIIDLLFSLRVSIKTLSKFKDDYEEINSWAVKPLEVPLSPTSRDSDTISASDSVTYDRLISKSLTDGALKVSKDELEKVKRIFALCRIFPFLGVLSSNLAVFIIQNENRKEGEAFDPRVRINFLLDPTAIFVDIIGDIVKYFSTNASIKYVAAFIDFPIAGLYFDVFINPFPGTPIITQTGNQLQVSFENPKGRYQEIDNNDTKIQWQEFNNIAWLNISGAIQKNYTVPAGSTNPIRVSVYYDLNFFNNKLYAYYPRIISTTIANNVLTVIFDTIIQTNQGTIGAGSFSIQSNTTPAATNLPTISDATKDDSSGKSVFTVTLNANPPAGNYKIVPAANALKDSNNNIVSTNQSNNTFTI